MSVEDPAYRVVFSERLRQQFKLMAKWAVRLGQSTDFLSTAKSILDALQRDPAGFGDPTRRLTQMDAIEYHALRGAIQVSYAVHDSKRIVFMKAIGYFPEYGKRQE
jgi:hypothetical protein